MTGEIDRVANEKVTVWSRIVTWIYGVVHGDPNKLKKKQSDGEMILSAIAFEDV